MASLENTMSQLTLQTCLPTDILRDEVAKWVAEKDRAAFAASCPAARDGMTRVRKAELLTDVFTRGHITPQPTSLHAERLPTIDEVMRRGAKSPMHVNFRGVLAWADKHFPPTPAEQTAPLRRFYQEAAEMFWPEVAWVPITKANPADDNIQYLQHKRYARRYPIDPMPKLLELKSQDPHATICEWMEWPKLANGAMRRENFETITGFGRLSCLELRNLPDTSELNPFKQRERVRTYVVLSESLGPCFSYSENLNHFRLGLKKGYAFYVSTFKSDEEPRSITFTAGMHHYCFLLDGVRTRIENGIMQVSLLENKRVKKIYPAISKNAAGLYCHFSADLSSAEKQAAIDLVRSGHCERIAGWREWLFRKENEYCW